MRLLSAAGICVGMVDAGLGMVSCATPAGEGFPAGQTSPLGVAFAASEGVAGQGIVAWRLYLGRSQFVVTGYDTNGAAVAGVQVASFNAQGGVAGHMRVMLLDGTGATLRAEVGGVVPTTFADNSTCPSCGSASASADIAVDPQHGEVAVVPLGTSGGFVATSTTSDSSSSGASPITSAQASLVHTLLSDLNSSAQKGLTGAAGPIQIHPLDLSAHLGAPGSVDPLTMGSVANCAGNALKSAAEMLGTALALGGTGSVCAAGLAAGPPGWAGCGVAAYGSYKAYMASNDQFNTAWDACANMFKDNVAPCHCNNGDRVIYSTDLSQSSTCTNAGDGGAGGEGGGSDGGAGSEGVMGSEAGYATAQVRPFSGRHHVLALASGGSETIAFSWNDSAGVAPPADLWVEAAGKQVLQVSSVGAHPFARAGLDAVPLEPGRTYELRFERGAHGGDALRVTLSSANGAVVLEREVRAAAEGSAPVADVVLPAATMRAAIASETLGI